MSLKGFATTGILPRTAFTVLTIALGFTGLLTSPAITHVAASQSAAPTMMTVYLPNITRMLGGPTGWQTPFIVQNVGTAATDLDIEFYSFADGFLVTKRHVSGLKPGTSFADVPNNDTDLPAGGQFSVVVRSSGSQIVSVVNEHQGAGARAEALSYVGLSSGSTKVSLPIVCKADDGWLTTFVMQNLGSGQTNATITLIGRSGNVTLTRTIQPGRSQFVDPRVEPTVPAGTCYAGTITADQPIAAIANVHQDGASELYPRAYSYNGIGQAGGDVYLPFVARNADNGRTSFLYIQNAGTTPATPMIELRRNGSTITIITDSIKPGDDFAFDPREDSELTDGEYSAIISGGQFAVLNETQGRGTAIGYTGTAQPAPRLYLPNVTRTLGGPTGWTTPIVLESAGATGATVRWYRFSDGALEKVDVQTGLTRGQGIRIDPRSVASLKDNAQYSVVIDGTGGNIAAVVLEYADGGDNAMAYEAFGGIQTPLPADTTPTPAAATPLPTATPAATAIPTPGATTPASAFAQPPDVYFKPIPGFTYDTLSNAQLNQLRSGFASIYGRMVLDSAGRMVNRNGQPVAVALVSLLMPNFANDEIFKIVTLDAVLSRNPGHSRKVSLGGTRAVFVNAATANDFATLVWFQGPYLVMVLGDDEPSLIEFGNALTNANR